MIRYNPYDMYLCRVIHEQNQNVPMIRYLFHSILRFIQYLQL